MKRAALPDPPLISSADSSVDLGPLTLSNPVVAASGTVAPEFGNVSDLAALGAVVAKSVAPEPWPGRPTPRIAPAGAGMLNGIGIQNPGIEAWVADDLPRWRATGALLVGSAVAETVDGFALVAAAYDKAEGVAAVEVNLSCPNLADPATMWALEPDLTRKVVEAVRAATAKPVLAKLSPNVTRLEPIAEAALEAGANILTIGNTLLGLRIGLHTRRPVLSGGVGGYSGAPLLPVALRFVADVHRAFPEAPIVGTGGVTDAASAVEMLLAGASAVGVGTAHFVRPDAGVRIARDLARWCRRRGVRDVAELRGAAWR